MNFLDSLILGLVEGITEFLPISSTGHLILTSHILNIASSEFLKTFEISIQLGAILAVVFLYWRQVFLNLEIIKKILLAFLPTALIGLIFYSVVKKYLLGSETVVLIALFLGGLLLILFEKIHREKPNAETNLENISYKNSFLIGLFQSIAIIPGVSRAAATIIGGLILNISRKTIVEFSFLLAIPTMAAATGLDLIKSPNVLEGNQIYLLLIGFITAFLSAILGIKFLLKFIQTHSFIPFGIYRIALTIAFAIFLL